MKGLCGRLKASAALACLLAAVIFCASCAGGGAREGSTDFMLVNHAGTSLRAVYVSPHDSEGWEENVLGSDKLLDGEDVEIGFDPRAKAAAWDLRVESTSGRVAEWKNLDLSRISRITLRVRDNVAVAEAE